MEDKIITFRIFDNAAIAKNVRARLEENSIPCFYSGEQISEYSVLFTNVKHGVTIKIFEKDYQRSFDLLSTDEIKNSLG